MCYLGYITMPYEQKLPAGLHLHLPVRACRGPVHCKSLGPPPRKFLSALFCSGPHPACMKALFTRLQELTQTVQRHLGGSSNSVPAMLTGAELTNDHDAFGGAGAARQGLCWRHPAYRHSQWPPARPRRRCPPQRCAPRSTAPRQRQPGRPWPWLPPASRCLPRPQLARGKQPAVRAGVPAPSCAPVLQRVSLFAKAQAPSHAAGCDDTAVSLTSL